MRLENGLQENSTSSGILEKWWIPPTIKLRLDVWKLSAKTNLHGQKGMMFTGTNIEPPTPVSQTAFGLCRKNLEKLKGLIYSIFFVDMLYVIFYSKVFKHIRLIPIVDNIII